MNDSDKNEKKTATEPKKPAEKPVSLAPLEFKEAVRGLLKTGRGEIGQKQ